MSTARDLMAVAVDASARRHVAQGELSLALAGAELVDLLAARAVVLDGDLIVPGGEAEALDDPLLGDAAAILVRSEPYEPVEDWLWRRGRDLAAAYAADRRANLDSRPPAHDPVLTGLATAAGVLDKDASTPTPTPTLPAADPPEAVGTVLAAVEDAVTELEAVRQRRAIEQAAFDNIWQAP